MQPILDTAKAVLDWLAADPQKLIIAFIAGAVFNALAAEWAAGRENKRIEARTVRAEERSESRDAQTRVRAARLDEIDQTQRYLTKQVSFLADWLLGRLPGVPNPPDPADFVGARIEYVGDGVAIGEYLTLTRELASRTSPGLTPADQERISEVMGRVLRLLREQRERVLRDEELELADAAYLVVSLPPAIPPPGP